MTSYPAHWLELQTLKLPLQNTRLYKWKQRLRSQHKIKSYHNSLCRHHHHHHHHHLSYYFHFSSFTFQCTVTTVTYYMNFWQSKFALTNSMLVNKVAKCLNLNSDWSFEWSSVTFLAFRITHLVGPNLNSHQQLITPSTNFLIFMTHNFLYAADTNHKNSQI